MADSYILSRDQLEDQRKKRIQFFRILLLVSVIAPLPIRLYFFTTKPVDWNTLIDAITLLFPTYIYYISRRGQQELALILFVTMYTGLFCYLPFVIGSSYALCVSFFAIYLIAAYVSESKISKVVNSIIIFIGALIYIAEIHFFNIPPIPSA
ncbi:MAG: hypothetical protein AAFR59_06415, partial [Bacteroidota bacterium]